MPRSGLTVRVSTRGPPILSRLSGRNPRDRSLRGNRYPCRGTRLPSHDRSSIQRCPRASPRDRATLRTERRVEDSAQARPRFRAELALLGVARRATALVLTGGVGLSPLASGTWDKSSVLGLPATCYRTSSVNVGGCLPICRHLVSPRSVESRRSPRNGCHLAEGVTRSPAPTKGRAHVHPRCLPR